jgi:uncharacterized protein
MARAFGAGLASGQANRYVASIRRRGRFVLKKFVAALLAFALVAPPLAAQTAAPAPAPKPIKAKPALWVVRDKDTTIYLFGTVHVLRPEVRWFDGAVKTAYDASSEVRLEMIAPEPAEMQELIVKLALDPAGKPLSEKLGPDTAALWRKTAGEMGLPVAGFEALKPWFAATVLSVVAIQKAGLNPESGAEKVLTTAAKRDGKTLSGFETAEEQLGFFNSFAEPVQIAFLKSSLTELPKAVPMLDAMIASWGKGDPEALGAQLNASMTDTPELGRVLLTERNKRWASWIAKRMEQPGTLFIAVGAGHLAGKESVQTHLKALKLKAKRVPS